MAEAIRTDYWPKPIPMRQFDWSAVRDGYDGGNNNGNGDPIGFGGTEAEAIADLLEKESYK